MKIKNYKNIYVNIHLSYSLFILVVIAIIYDKILMLKFIIIN